MSKSLRLASTLIIVRPTVHGPVNMSQYRVLYVKRSLSASFMPGAHVFPGGVVEDVDRHQDWLKLIPGAEKLDDLPLRLAGIREAFEESSVLLADGPLPHRNVAQSWRSDCQSDSMQFLRFCQQHEIVPRVASLKRWAHWITPKAERKRFDTHFYVAVADADVEPLVDDTETIRFDWASPPEALALFEDQKISFPPPTWYETRRLADHLTVDKLCAAADRLTAANNEIAAILPQIQPPRDDGTLVFAMSGDELYTENGERNSSGTIHRVELNVGAEPGQPKYKLIKRLHKSKL